MKNKIAIILFCCICISTSILGQPNEYLIKGILLEKFSRFVEWPEYDNVNISQDPFIIGVIGRNPFDPDLETLYENRLIKSKAVEIKHISYIHDVEQCNLLFIARSEKYRLPQIVDKVRNMPILTISDSDEFSGKGIIINIKLEDEKIRFDIDESAAHNSGLSVSHLLLKEAKVINPVRRTQ